MSDKINSIIDEYLAKNDDFGFSSENEDIKSNDNEMKYKENLETIEKMVMPFYVNLMNAKGDTIKWPEDKRKEQIKKQIEQLIKLTRV